MARPVPHRMLAPEVQLPDDEGESQLRTGQDGTWLFLLLHSNPGQLGAGNSKGFKGLENCNQEVVKGTDLIQFQSLTERIQAREGFGRNECE